MDERPTQLSEASAADLRRSIDETRAHLERVLGELRLRAGDVRQQLRPRVFIYEHRRALIAATVVVVATLYTASRLARWMLRYTRRNAVRA